MCAAMEATAEPDYSSVLPDVNPAETHQQGMSPNTASATAVADAQGPMQDAVMAAGHQGVDGGVAVRTMAVAVATGQSGGTPNWQAVQASPTERVDAADHMVGAVEHSFGQMNAAQASWNVVTSRRTTPVWIQRLGAFFHEMRNQQVTWPPSPMGSPPARQMSAQGSPEAEQRGRGSPALLSPEQQERLRRMEQRAPLLYGPPRGERLPEGNGSSGGSTYEAVQRQLRGVVSQLEASKREAQDLRHEVALLRAEREQAGVNGQLEDMAAGRVPGQPSQGRSYYNCQWCLEPTSKIFYQRDVGCTIKLAYRRGIGLTSRVSYFGGIGLTSRVSYLGGIGLTSRVSYLGGIGLTSRLSYLRGVGLTSKLPYCDSVWSMYNVGNGYKFGCANGTDDSEPNNDLRSDAGTWRRDSWELRSYVKVAGWA